MTLRLPILAVAGLLGAAAMPAAVGVPLPTATVVSVQVGAAHSPQAHSPHAAGRAASSRRSHRHNIAPQPDFFDACAVDGANSRPCIDQTVAAIRNARSHERGVKRAMVLPANYTSLTVAEQTFVVTDLERVARGVRPIRGLTRRLNSAAHRAAVAHDDPILGTLLMKLLHMRTWGSIWASDLGPLASDYDWMYNDGYAKNGINVACRTPQSAGCWGHRKNILYRYRHLPVLLAGAGTAKPRGSSIAEVIGGGTGPAPHFVYTWNQALAHGANGHRATARRR